MFSYRFSTSLSSCEQIFIYSVDIIFFNRKKGEVKMRKVISCTIIGILVLSGLAAAAIPSNQNPQKSQRENSTSSPYIDELDQSMTDYDGALPVGNTNLGVYVNLSAAQSFIPQKEVLTRAQFLMGRNALASYPCVLAVRNNLTGENLASISVGPNEFPVVNETPSEDQLAWINFDFPDLWVTPGLTYYLVVYTTNITGNYYWVSGNGTNIYPNGTAYYSIDNGATWTELTDSDGCFKTYGLRETFLNITSKSGLFGPSFTVKNIGNYTAWDVAANITIKGGILGRINYQSIGGISELLPDNELFLKNKGLLFGFGLITISMHISAANVKEIIIEKNAKIFLFFIHIQ
jgi:hypothetical protein